MRISGFVLAALCTALLPPAHAVDAAHDRAQRRPAARTHVAAKPHEPAVPLRDPRAERWLDVAGFGAVAIYKPPGASRGLALFASGDGGWNRGVLDMAQRAAALGFWVAGFSTPQFLKELDHDGAACSDADGRLAKLGRDLVQQLQLPPATRPVLIGYSSGATVVYAALAADAGQHFGGGISLAFCPDLRIRKPFCAGPGGLTQQRQQRAPFDYVFDQRDSVAVPWRILQGDADQVCDPRFAAEFAAGQKDARAIVLPKVGHGFGVPRNWMPQYAQSVRDLLDPAH